MKKLSSQLKKLAKIGIAGLMIGLPLKSSADSFGITTIPFNLRAYSEKQTIFPKAMEGAKIRHVVVPGADFNEDINIGEGDSDSFGNKFCLSKAYYKNPILDLELLYFLPSSSSSKSLRHYWPWPKPEYGEEGFLESAGNPYYGSEVVYIRREKSIGQSLELRIAKGFKIFEVGAGISKSNAELKFIEGTEKYGIENDEKTTQFPYDVTEKNISVGLKLDCRTKKVNVKYYLEFMRFMRDYKSKNGGEDWDSNGGAIGFGIEIGRNFWSNNK